MTSQLEEAVSIIEKGGIVIFPTDTTFVIGCRMDSKESVKRLYRIRKRPATQAALVLVDSLSMAQEYLIPISENVKKRLIKKYWPGALTVVYPCKIDVVDGLVRAEGATLGVRMPDHADALNIIGSLGIPILGPSANFHGEQTPYSFDQLSPELMKLSDYVLSGNTKNIGLASTVVDCSVDPWNIIRKGAISI